MSTPGVGLGPADAAWDAVGAGAWVASAPPPRGVGFRLLVPSDDDRIARSHALPRSDAGGVLPPDDELPRQVGRDPVFRLVAEIGGLGDPARAGHLARCRRLSGP